MGRSRATRRARTSHSLPLLEARPLFVKVSDLPPACRENGKRVEYSLVPNFDNKKGKESVRAVRVSPA